VNHAHAHNDMICIPIMAVPQKISDTDNLFKYPFVYFSFSQL